MPQSKLSIVQVIDQLNIGGAENVLVTLANILSRHGHNVTVVTTVTPGPLASQLDKSITLINIARTGKWNIACMYKLYQVIKQYDVIHVHSSYNLRYLFLSARLFFLRKPIFFHEHFGDIEIDAGVKWHHRFIYPKTTMICVSRKIYDWAAANLPIDKNKLFILPNIVLKKEGLPERKKRDGILDILMVSNIRPTKNIEFAIELLGRLTTSRICRLTLVGQKMDEVYYQKVVSLINNFNLTDKVNILHGVTDVQSLMHQYDMAVHTARSESGPLVLIEYLAQGLPFLSYNTGETVFQIKDELPECIIQSFELADWVSQIEKLLLIPSETISQRLSSVYADKFSSEAYYRQCLDIYEKGLRK